jgi:cellulose synthase/poly-beta-1,6-N-acetylglucosamine synthase-like glycosyltransferase
MDLSYRAQLAGWSCLYLPDVDVPAEIPPTITAFKRQQARWAAGTIQCLRKLAQRALLSHLGWWQKVETVLHLSGYLVHPLMLVMLFTSVPLMLSGSLSSLPLAPLGLASLVPPLMALVSQRLLYPDWRKRLAYFPLLLLMGVGIAVSNTWAVWLGLRGKKLSFQRTPKFHLNNPCDRWVTSAYARPAQYSTWIELALALYAGLAALLALTRSPGLVAFLVIYMLGFGYIGGLGLWQAGQLYLEQRGVYAEAVNPEC